MKFSENKELQHLYLDDTGLPSDEVTKQCDLSQYFSRLNIQDNQRTNLLTDIFFYPNKLGKQSIIKINLASYLKENHQINFDHLNFREKIEISILYHTSNYQVINLGVQYGNFCMHLNIINVDAKSSSNNLHFIQSGGFGQVCKAQFEQKTVAIKRIRIFENRFQQIIDSAIRQYLLLAVASALNSAPKIDKLYGFDLVVFRDYIEFSMEFCIKNENKKDLLQHLKEKIFIMHRLHLIHCDIKPQNIAYSQSYQTYVFLDFGLSLLAKEKIGEKTITSFMGSIQYCGKQMWELFMNNSQNKVDLYLNDVVSLQKSLTFLKEEPSSQPNNQNVEQITTFTDKDSRLFSQSQIIIMIKYILFHNTINLEYQTRNLSKYKQYFRFFTSKIVDFIKLLPLNKNFVGFYKKYCHFGEEEGLQHEIIKSNFRCNKNSAIAQDMSCDTFASRFHLLNALNPSKHGIYAVQKMKDKKITNISLQKPTDNLSAYILTIVNIIKINGETDNFDDKIIACKDVLNVFMIECAQMSDIEIYKRVMAHIFEYCMSNLHVQNHEIIIQTIPTIIILQIVPETDVLTSFKMTLGLQIPFVKKMLAIMQFITSLEFISQKYKTSYNYDSLTESFLLLLDNYLDTFFKSYKFVYKEQMCFYRLKQIIYEKIGHIKQINNKSTLVLSLKIVSCVQYFNNTLHLLHDIETYLAYCQGKYQFNRTYQISIQSYAYILNAIQLRFNHSSQISYLHFSYFYNNYQFNKYYQIMQTYGLFQLQLGKFQEITHFKIYFLNMTKRLKDDLISKGEMYLFWRNKRIPRNIQSVIKLVFQILQKMIDCRHQYYFYIDQTYQLMAILQDNPQMTMLFQQFFNKNISKLVQFSGKYHKNSHFYHNSNLKIEISTIANIIATYGSLNKNKSQQLFTQFIQKAYQVVHNSKCFLCKVSCLLEIKQIEAFKAIDLDPKQDFAIMADLLAVYLKNSDYITDVERTIVNLIRYWRKSPILVNRYNLNDFIYEYSKKQNSICICLTNMREYNIFLCLYIHFSQFRTVEQLTNFIFDIVRQLQDKKASHMITIFYNNMLAIIQMTENKFLQDLKEYHDLVIRYIIQNKIEEENPYMAIYFSTILQIRLKGQMDYEIIKKIRQGLSRVDTFAKKILLNLYYQQFAFYYSMIPKKKIRYVMSKHFKHCFKKFSLQTIIKKKLILRKQQNRCLLKSVQLKKTIEKYHKNNENIK